MADGRTLIGAASVSLRFDIERPRSSVPAGPIRGIMPRPQVVRPPPSAAAPARAGGATPARPPAMQQAGRAAVPERRTGRPPYGGRGEPPAQGSGWDAFLDWAARDGFETDEDRALAFRAWAGRLRPADEA